MKGWGKSSIILLITLFITSIYSHVHFDNKELKVDTHFHYQTTLMISKTEKWALYNDLRPYLAINQTIEQRREVSDYSFIEVLIYHLSRQSDIGYLHPSTHLREFCCTREMIAMGICSEFGTVITNNHLIHKIKIDFTRDQPSFPLYIKYDYIGEHGIFVVDYFNCFDGKAGDVIISGDIKWRNPIGYLSADLFPLLIFYEGMGGIYAALGIFWLIFFVYNYNRNSTYHYLLSLIFFFSAFEIFLHLFNLHSFNSSGVNEREIIIITTMITTALRKAIFRMYILLIAFGFGIFDLSKKRYFSIGIFGLCYFSLSLIEQILFIYENSLKNSLDFFYFFENFFVFPTNFLDFFLYFYLFFLIKFTMDRFKSNSLHFIVRNYQILAMILIFTGVLSALLSLSDLVAKKYWENETWEVKWIFTGYWDLLHLFLLFTFAYLWQPKFVRDFLKKSFHQSVLFDSPYKEH